MNRRKSDCRRWNAVRGRSSWPWLGLVLMLAFAGCLRLDSFLFEPGPLDEYFRPEDMQPEWPIRGVIPDSLREEVRLYPATGETVFGFFVRAAPDSAPTPTIIYSHGNAGNINGYWNRVEYLWEAGCNVLIYDYEGFGCSTGTPTGPACYADADAALAWCLARTDIDTSLIGYLGWSLGSFMAMHLAADVRQPKRVLLEAPMASVSGIAKEGALLDIPGSFLVDADFDNVTRIRKMQGSEVLIIFGRKDKTAIPERTAEVLVREGLNAGVDVDTIDLADADHLNLPNVMGFDNYRRTVREFFTFGNKETP
jgi:alpha/beta superfamily hydrolase